MWELTTFSLGCNLPHGNMADGSREDFFIARYKLISIPPSSSRPFVSLLWKPRGTQLAEPVAAAVVATDAALATAKAAAVATAAAGNPLLQLLLLF